MRFHIPLHQERNAAAGCQCKAAAVSAGKNRTGGRQHQLLLGLEQRGTGLWMETSCISVEMLPCVTFTFLLQMVEKGGCDIKKTGDQNVFVVQQSLQSLKGILKEQFEL